MAMAELLQAEGCMTQPRRPGLAVILAAGRGTRLYPLTRDVPKCLLPVGNRTILEHQLGVLQSSGVNEIVIVTGFLAEQVRAAAAGQASFVHNPEYATTNTLHSLWAARHVYQGRSFVCLYSDLLFHPDILRRCLETEGDVVLAVDENLAEETARVRLVDSRVTEIRKGIPPGDAFGTFLGMAVFSTTATAALVRVLEELIARDDSIQAYFTVAIEQLSREGFDVQCSTTGGLPWIEIDFPHELEIARRNILPAIEENPREGL